MLDELAERIRKRFTRPIHLVIENESNDPTRLIRRDRTPVRYTAQWNDDVHHVLHVAATRESSGYYADYGEVRLLADALAEGFAYQGQMMPYRGANSRRPERRPAAQRLRHVHPESRPDRTGVRRTAQRACAARGHPRTGERLSHRPATPMLFMGEEWGAEQPFPYFCDFHGQLADAIRKGRREEFSGFRNSPIRSGPP